MYKPLKFELPKIKKVKDIQPTFTLTQSVPLPLFTFGFNHFVQIAKDKMGFLSDKKKWYIMPNEFEPDIEYDKSIKNMSVKKLGKELSDEEYNLKEIMVEFDLNKKTLIKNKSGDGTEHDQYMILIGEISDILKTLEKNGLVVIKFYETFTIPSIKLIQFLCMVFDSVWIYKPFISKLYSSEKYLICKHYNPITISFDKIKIKKGYLENIFLTLELDPTLVNTIKQINITLSNLQHININSMVEYLNSNNYYGDKYHEYLEKQKAANDFWLKTYL